MPALLAGAIAGMHSLEKEKQLIKLLRLVAVGAVAIMGGALLTGCTPAKAGLGVAGSFTTNGVMDNLAFRYSGNPNGANPNSDPAYDIPATVFTGSQSYDLPNDGQSCPGIHYSTSNQPPNGSGAGISALINDTNGCIDIARSSRGRSGSDPANIDFYAFAIDGVSWSGYAGGKAPVNLTQAQLQGIYLCTNGGRPAITNWNQVGGQTGSIIRYLPQVNSGTLAFFETRILGLSSAQQGVLDDSACQTKPIRIQENSGDQVVSGFRPFAINPYSFADWTAQKNGVLPDHRGGSFLGAVNGVGPAPASTQEGCGPCFLGRRYVYNVLKQGSRNFDNALNFAGVDSSHNGWLCNNSDTVRFVIAGFGFVPLNVAPAGSGLPNSTCRKNPTPL
jgi:phosphate transport system substrate-binding protein